MLYVSDLLGKPVVDADGQPAGRLQDLLVKAQTTQPHPQIVGMVMRKESGDTLVISTADVAVLVGPAVILSHSLAEIAPWPADDVLWLARDVLDKEIIDTDAARVIRVNDLHLERVGSAVHLANAAVGGLAVMRRLGLLHLAERLAKLTGHTATTIKVPWENVEFLPGEKHVRMRFSSDKTQELHAADLANIISDLSPAQSTQVVHALDVERLADTLEEVEPDFQASLVKSLPDAKMADVLEKMAPDEAADLLAELPQDRCESLLDLMDKENAANVRQLLTYAENTAGGLMTTEVVTVRPGLTAGQAIARVRQTAQQAETIYYVYVVDEQEHLLGVFSLKRLVLSDPDTPVSAFMHDRVVDVKPDTSQNDVAQLVATYNLLAVPVVDDENHLLGIVTADDALDKILPSSWKKHLPRLYG